MPYALAFACLGWVATTCALLWLVARLLNTQADERQAHRSEVAAAARALGEMAQAHRAELAALGTTHAADLAATHATHADQIETLLTTHRREVANLCQRIQAPQIAVAEHAAVNAPPDPPQVDLENDLALIADRERQLREFAEELATER